MTWWWRSCFCQNIWSELRLEEIVCGSFFFLALIMRRGRGQFGVGSMIRSYLALGWWWRCLFHDRVEGQGLVWLKFHEGWGEGKGWVELGCFASQYAIRLAFKTLRGSSMIILGSPWVVRFINLNNISWDKHVSRYGLGRFCGWDPRIRWGGPRLYPFWQIMRQCYQVFFSFLCYFWYIWL